MQILHSREEMMAIVKEQRRTEVKIMQKLLAAAPSMPPMVALGVAQKITRGE